MYSSVIEYAFDRILTISSLLFACLKLLSMNSLQSKSISTTIASTFFANLYAAVVFPFALAPSIIINVLGFMLSSNISLDLGLSLKSSNRDVGRESTYVSVSGIYRLYAFSVKNFQADK